ADRHPSMEALAKDLATLLANWPEDAAAPSISDPSKDRRDVEETFSGDAVLSTRQFSAIQNPRSTRPWSKWLTRPSTLLTVLTGLALGGGLAGWNREPAQPPSVADPGAGQASLIAPVSAPPAPVIEAPAVQASPTETIAPPGPSEEPPERGAEPSPIPPANLKQAVEPAPVESVEEKK